MQPFLREIIFSVLVNFPYIKRLKIVVEKHPRASLNPGKE
jgi:hypothetical protein